MLLKDKVVLVVGATSGIGKGIAEVAAKEGAMVVLTGRRRESGEAIAAAIRETGGKAEFLQMDVLNLPSCYAAIDSLIAKHGKLDTLFYNAGVCYYPVNIDNGTEEQWDAMFNTNTRSAFFLLQKVMPELEKTKGSAVFTSAAAGVSCGNGGGEAVYAASKAALNHMIEVVAMAVAKRGVRLNAVCPGPVITDIFKDMPKEAYPYLAKTTPMNVLLEPEDLGNAAVFLASDNARYITGQIVGVDGGMTLC